MRTVVKHYLQLYDRRFQNHYSFLFSAFNMMQRHEMLQATSFKVRRDTFEQLASSFADVDTVTVHVVAEREARGDKVTAHNNEEKKVLKLMNEIRLLTAHVEGSPTSMLFKSGQK